MTDISQLSTQQLEIATTRLEWLRRWEESGISNARMFCAGVSSAPSCPSLYRWRDAYKKGGLVALAPKWGSTTAGEGSRNSLSEEVKLQLQAAYLRQSKPSMRDAVRCAEMNCGHGISYHAARRFLMGLDPALVSYMREGEKALNDKWIPHVIQDYSKFRAGQRYVMDHHTLDVVVRDSKGRLFRPYLTLCIDFRSRKPIGWCICESPNSFSISKALQMALRSYGMPEEILIDNGKDFNAKYFRGHTEERVVTNEGLVQKEFIKIQGVFDAMGIRVINSTPYRGQSKNIERFFRDVATQYAKWIPTYVGSNTVTRPEEAKLLYRNIAKESKREVFITLSDMDTMVGSWLEWWAEHHSHSGRGMEGKSPNEVFATKQELKPVGEDIMRLLFARVEMRTVRRQGVQLDTWYWSDELIGLQGESVQVRRAYDDVSFVWVCDVQGRQLCKAYADVFVGGTEEALQQSRNAGKKLRRRVREAEKVIREAQEEQVSPVEHAMEWYAEKKEGTTDESAGNSTISFDEIKRTQQRVAVSEENKNALKSRKGLFDE